MHRRAVTSMTRRTPANEKHVDETDSLVALSIAVSKIRKPKI